MVSGHVSAKPLWMRLVIIASLSWYSVPQGVNSYESFRGEYAKPVYSEDYDTGKAPVYIYLRTIKKSLHFKFQPHEIEL